MNFTGNTAQKDNSESSKRLQDSLHGYNRSILASSGMVHIILGLAYLITWGLILDLFFYVELAFAVSFILSGSIALSTRFIFHRYLVYISMATGILSSLVSIAMFAAVFYIFTHINDLILFNPISEIFLIYSVMGFIFSTIIVKYAYYTILWSKMNLQGGKRFASEHSATSIETKMTSAPHLQNTLRITTIDIANVDTNSNNEEKATTATSSV